MICTSEQPNKGKKHIELGLHFFSLITVSDPKTVEFYLQVFEVV